MQKQSLATDPFHAGAQGDHKLDRISSPAERAAVARELASLQRDGYVILRNLVPAETVTEIWREMDRLHQNTPMGRSMFEGFHTQRIYNVVAKTRVMDQLWMHPSVIALAESYLDDQIQLSVASTITSYPGQTAQVLHRDDGYYPLPRPRPPLSLNCLWAIDPFTAASGGTLIVPGSHTNASEERPAQPPISVEMPPGSVVFYDASLFHGGGANVSQDRRAAVSAVYCRAWLRQQENQYLCVPPAIAKTIPPVMQRLIGYWVVGALLGVVEGGNCRQVLKD
jgi:ectoine hydroxylase-related dioxygenase (phytanoyl-CoA dioxygenase family)